MALCEVCLPSWWRVFVRCTPIIAQSALGVQETRIVRHCRKALFVHPRKKNTSASEFNLLLLLFCNHFIELKWISVIYLLIMDGLDEPGKFDDHPGSAVLGRYIKKFWDRFPMKVHFGSFLNIIDSALKLSLHVQVTIYQYFQGIFNFMTRG